MILSDKTIHCMMQNQRLVITPIDEEQIQPASVDIRLGNTFSIVEDSTDGVIDLEQEITYKRMKSDTYILLPGQFVLATTREYIKLPDNLTAFVEANIQLVYNNARLASAIAADLSKC